MLSSAINALLFALPLTVYAIFLFFPLFAIYLFRSLPPLQHFPLLLSSLITLGNLIIFSWALYLQIFVFPTSDKSTCLVDIWLLGTGLTAFITGILSRLLHLLSFSEINEMWLKRERAGCLQALQFTNSWRLERSISGMLEEDALGYLHTSRGGASSYSDSPSEDINDTIESKLNTMKSAEFSTNSLTHQRFTLSTREDGSRIRFSPPVLPSSPLTTTTPTQAAPTQAPTTTESPPTRIRNSSSLFLYTSSQNASVPGTLSSNVSSPTSRLELPPKPTFIYRHRRWFSSKSLAMLVLCVVMFRVTINIVLTALKVEDLNSEMFNVDCALSWSMLPTLLLMTVIFLGIFPQFVVIKLDTSAARKESRELIFTFVLLCACIIGTMIVLYLPAEWLNSKTREYLYASSFEVFAVVQHVVLVLLPSWRAHRWVKRVEHEFNGSRRTDQGFRRMLENAVAFEEFKDFMLLKLNVALPICYKKIEDIMQQLMGGGGNSPSMQRQQVRLLYLLFFAHGAPLAVKVSGYLKELFMEEYCRHECSHNMLSTIKNELRLQMWRDYWTEFLEWKHSNEVASC